MRVLLAIDDSAFSEAATKAVINQLEPSKWEVCVLHSFHPLDYLTQYGRSEAVVKSLQAVEDLREAEVKKLLSRTQQALEKAGFKVTPVLDLAEPREAIVDRASKWKADLIVVGSHGWEGLDRLVLGSVAEFVARHASCSVQIVRLPGREKPSERTQRA